LDQALGEKNCTDYGQVALDAVTSAVCALLGGLGWAGMKGVQALRGARGLVQNPMFRHALQQYNRFQTNVGHALAKHPNIVGLRTNAELYLRFGNDAGVNRAAAEALKNIMRNGIRTVKDTKAFGKVVDFKLPSGLGARFSAVTNQFIGFLGRGL
jgi:filamentous hemagglutinin